MRKPEYISPSAFNLFYRNRYEYYRQYLTDIPIPRIKQTQPMAAGHAFDIKVKEYLGETLGYDVDKGAMDKNIEPHNKEFAAKAGKILFDLYKDSGALGNLMQWLQRTKEDPIFEDTVSATIGGVPVLGKPDLYFKLPEARIIHDWKVSGFCSYASPCKGYINILPDQKAHKLSKIEPISLKSGLLINKYGMEELSPEWATQQCFYAWSLGEAVGANFVVGIDQITKSKKGVLRVSIYRSRVSKEFQQMTFDRLKKMWKIIESGDKAKFFDDLPENESIALCERLDKVAKIYGPDSPVRPEVMQQYRELMGKH